MNSRVYTILIIVIIVFSLSNCAKRGKPTGGAKDETPPMLMEAKPPLETTNFDASRIRIYFDEYIKLKDVKKKLVISPPQQYDPIITPVGTASKFITIKILDTLDDNTTYLFNFGNSIVDNNEENELGEFKYVFSTGTYIDSLKISGEIIDPLVKKPVTEIDVMLYQYDSTYTDSIIYKQKPRYIASTLDSTLYNLTNLKGGKYLMIALKDGNNNKIYDPRTDKIGFVEDTIVLPGDTLYNFKIFKEIPELRVFRPKEVQKGKLIFGYQGEADSLKIELTTPVGDDFKSEFNYAKDQDTINYWYTPFEADSLNFIVTKGDYVDSLVVKLRSSVIDTLKVSKSSQGNLALLDTFSLNTNNPIVKFDPSKISLIDQDTVAVEFSTTLAKSKTKLYIDFKKKYDSKYNLQLLPGLLTDVYGFENDSIQANLSTNNPENYGGIKLNITSSKNTALIVELLDLKGIVVRTIKMDKPSVANFQLLKPASYNIRVVIDDNGNGKWDTGDFLKKIQPERIIFFDQTIELQANWEFIEPFNIE